MPAATASSGSPPHVPWQQPYHFRREVVVVNPESSTLHRFPLLLNLNFSEGSAFSGNEVRLFDSSGVEVPSSLVDYRISDGFLVSAILLTLVNVPAKSNTFFWLYYGYPEEGVPLYRQGSAAASAALGPVSLALGSPQSQSFITFNYARTYSETIEPVVSYVSQNRTVYGPAPFDRLFPVGSWEAMGNTTSLGAAMATSSFRAGSLSYSEFEIVSNSSVISIDQVANLGSVALNEVRLSLIINASDLTALGPLKMYYNESAGLATAFVAGAYLGFSTNPPPAHHEVGAPSSLLAHLNPGGKGVIPAAGGSVGVLMTWSAGTLQAGGTLSVRSVLSISSTPRSLAAAPASPGVRVGREETSSEYLPSANGLWRATLELRNSSVPSSGLQVPLQVKEGALLPDTLTLSGTVNYTWPSPGFSVGAGIWTSSSHSSGNAVAYASPSFWSVNEGAHLGRIAAFNYNGSGSSTSSLVSSLGAIGSSNDQSLALNYMARISSSLGDPSAQELYAALNIYNGTSGRPYSTLYFPVEGSSANVVSPASCGHPSIGPQSGGGAVGNTKVAAGGRLVGDGSWRNLKVDLSSLLRPGASRLQFLFCASAAKGFVGQMELQVASAGVLVTVPAQSIMRASTSGAGPYVDLSFADGAVPSPAAISVHLRLSFDIVSTVQMNQSSGAVFSSPIPKPVLSIGHGFSNGNESAVPLVSEGIVVYTQFYRLEPSLLVNGTDVSGVASGGGVVIAPRSDLSKAGLLDPKPTTQLKLVLQAVSLGIRVNDASGNPLPGATVRVLGEGAAAGFSGSTGPDGTFSFKLMPWNYTVLVVWKGSVVYGSASNLRSNQTVQVSASVYDVKIEAKDVLGRPLRSAGVSIGGYGFSETFTMTAGSLNLQLPAGRPYYLSVDVAGSQVYSGVITAVTNDSTILLGTSYILPWVQLGTAAVVIAAIAIAAFVIFRRKGNFTLRTLTRIRR